MVKFIKENKFLSFVLFTSLVNALLYYQTLNYNILLILIFVAIILSVIIDKIGHIMQFISLNKLTINLEETGLKLKKSEQDFRNFFEQTNIPMCIFDLKSLKFIKANKFLCNLLEYSEEELRYLDLKDLIIAEDLKDSIRVAELNINNLKEENHINRYITKSGKIVKLQWTFTNANEDNISYCVALPIID